MSESLFAPRKSSSGEGAASHPAGGGPDDQERGATAPTPAPLSPSAELPIGYGVVDGTVWPINVGETEWKLRYAPDAVTPLYAASIVRAYSHLIDPTITQGAAIEALKRARKAQAS